jgi:flagellar motor switch protein FliG
MAAFAKLTVMQDLEIQQWLRKIDAEDLKIAMTKMDHQEQICILRNMSSRAGEVLTAFGKEAQALPAETVMKSCQHIEQALDMM